MAIDRYVSVEYVLYGHMWSYCDLGIWPFDLNI